jgi:hypothetical protein
MPQRGDENVLRQNLSRRRRWQLLEGSHLSSAACHGNWKAGLSMFIAAFELPALAARFDIAVAGHE